MEGPARSALLSATGFPRMIGSCCVRSFFVSQRFFSPDGATELQEQVYELGLLSSIYGGTKDWLGSENEVSLCFEYSKAEVRLPVTGSDCFFGEMFVCMFNFCECEGDKEEIGK